MPYGLLAETILRVRRVMENLELKQLLFPGLEK